LLSDSIVARQALKMLFKDLLKTPERADGNTENMFFSFAYPTNTDIICFQFNEMSLNGLFGSFYELKCDKNTQPGISLL